MIGFVQKIHGQGSLDSHHVQCFVGQQTKHFNLRHSTEVEEGEGAKIAKIDNGSPKSISQQATEDAFGGPADEENLQLSEEVEASTFIRESHKRLSHKRYNAHHAHVASDKNDLLIDAINSNDLGWKADTCKYQKQHANYGSHCESQILAQIQSKQDEEEAEGEAENESEGSMIFGEGENFEKTLE